MGFEWLGSWMCGDEGVPEGQVVAIDENVLVCSAATFGGYDVREVFGGNLVHDAYEALVPFGFAVSTTVAGRRSRIRSRNGREKSGFFVVVVIIMAFNCFRRALGIAVSRVCEARLDVGNARKIEGQDQFWDDHIGLAEGSNASLALKGSGAEIGAIGQVENGRGIGTASTLAEDSVSVLFEIERPLAQGVELALRRWAW